MRAMRGCGLMVLAVCASGAWGQQIQISKENKTIAINTSDEASAVADMAVVSIGFQSFGKEQQAIYAEASQTSNAIVSALNVAGLPDKQIESEAQSLSPLAPEGDENRARYAQGLRFEFNQSWRVTVPASQAAKVLQLAISAGANNSGNIDWQMRDDNALQAEAARKALEHARQIAAGMAQGLGARLGSLIYASNQAPPRGIFANSGFGNVELNTESASLSVMQKIAKPLAITPARIVKSATVYAVFAIE